MAGFGPLAGYPLAAPTAVVTASSGGSTGAVLYLKIRTSVLTQRNGTTGAVLYIKLTASASSYTPVNGSTGAIVYFSVRAASGLISSSGVNASRNLTNLQSLLPPQRQPMVIKAENGYICDPTWYRFFDFFVNVFLGGTNGRTLTDIINSITSVQEAAMTAEMRSILVEQQTQANAQSLAATIEVVTNNALVGAEQIPPASTTYQEP